MHKMYEAASGTWGVKKNVLLRDLTKVLRDLASMFQIFCEILQNFCFRHFRHGVLISERHLKRLLNARGLFRSKAYTDLTVLVEFISNQLQYSGQLQRYRWMYAKCYVMIVGLA